MRSLNQMLLIMAAAGLVSWLAASLLMDALTRHLTALLWLP